MANATIVHYSIELRFPPRPKSSMTELSVFFQLHSSLTRLRDRRYATFIPWAPAGIRVCLSRRSPYVKTPFRVSGLMLANHTSISSLFSKTMSMYDKLIKRGAFIEQFRKEAGNVDVMGEFSAAREVCTPPTETAPADRIPNSN